MKRICFIFIVLSVTLVTLVGCNQGTITNGNRTNNAETQRENNVITSSANSKTSNSKERGGLNTENNITLRKTNPDAFKRKGISGNIGGFQFGEAAVWPKDIPDDIPKFEGSIQQIMRDDYYIRIFFVNVSDKYMEHYLEFLKDRGFILEYKIYTRQGFPDDSKERLQRKDYDAVTATKGSLKINIEFGSELVTYDIDLKGFSKGKN